MGIYSRIGTGAALFSPRLRTISHGELIMKNRIALTGLVALAGLLIVGQGAEASSYQHIDGLALRIQTQSAALYKEFRLHYSHTADYPHLISDSRNLYYRSKHIHELAHHHGHLNHIASDLRSLDYAFHHLERLLHNIEMNADVGHFGHVHGQTAHVHDLMKQLETNIHHLREDIEALTAPHHSGHGVVIRSRTIGTTPIIIRKQNHGEVRSGWTFGLNNLHRGRSQIRAKIQLQR